MQHLKLNLLHYNQHLQNKELKQAVVIITWSVVHSVRGEAWKKKKNHQPCHLSCFQPLHQSKSPEKDAHLEPLTTATAFPGLSLGRFCPFLTSFPFVFCLAFFFWLSSIHHLSMLIKPCLCKPDPTLPL